MFHTIHANQRIFGTYKLKPDDLRNALPLAISRGFNRFDTAKVYGNEKYVGAILEEYISDRSKYRITTKIWDVLDISGTVEHCRKTAEVLGKIDTILLHCPMWSESWKGLCESVDLGYTTDIGVSNHNVDDIMAIYSENPTFLPSVNQIEIHPHVIDRDPIVNFCDLHNIEIQAHSILTRQKSTFSPSELAAWCYQKYPHISYCMTALSDTHFDEILNPQKLTDAQILNMDTSEKFKIYKNKEGNIRKPRGL